MPVLVVAWAHSWHQTAAPSYLQLRDLVDPPVNQSNSMKKSSHGSPVHQCGCPTTSCIGILILRYVMLTRGITEGLMSWAQMRHDGRQRVYNAQPAWTDPEGTSQVTTTTPSCRRHPSSTNTDPFPYLCELSSGHNTRSVGLIVL